MFCGTSGDTYLNRDMVGRLGDGLAREGDLDDVVSLSLGEVAAAVSQLTVVVENYVARYLSEKENTSEFYGLLLKLCLVTCCAIRTDFQSPGLHMEKLSL